MDIAMQKKTDDAKANNEAKKVKEQAAFVTKKAEVYNKLVVDISKGVEHICALPKATLLQLRSSSTSKTRHQIKQR